MTILRIFASESDRPAARQDRGAPRLVSLDCKRLATRLHALGRDVRDVLAKVAPEARRRLLQRVLNGRRIACEPFRDAGRRGYRFRATGNYAGLLSNGKPMSLDWDLGSFTLAGEAAA